MALYMLHRQVPYFYEFVAMIDARSMDRVLSLLSLESDSKFEFADLIAWNVRRLC